jgi:HD superfamily phosphodiesterase
VARHAENIGKAEGGNLAVILASAYLHDLGSENTGSTSSDPARLIMTGLGASKALIDEVCGMIDRLHALDAPDTPNFKILNDALLIASLEEKQKAGTLSPESVRAAIENTLMTDSGREMAARLFMNEQEIQK